MRIIETNLNFGRLNYQNSCTSIVLHHAAHSTCNIYDVHRWHKNKGWSGIGYHFFITKDGDIYRGRPENALGAHCLKYNKDTIGICVQGNYSTENMPLKQKESVIEVCRYLSDKYNIKTIKGHKELNQTRCPGKKYPLNEIRQAILNQYSDKTDMDTYIVKSGDTLWRISRKYNISVDELKKLNNLTFNTIYPNQILRII